MKRLNLLLNNLKKRLTFSFNFSFFKKKKNLGTFVKAKKKQSFIGKFKYEICPKIESRTKNYIKQAKTIIKNSGLKLRIMDICFTSLLVAFILRFILSDLEILKGLSIVLLLEVLINYVKQFKQALS